MPTVPFQLSNVAVDLKPAPIVPEWIVEGNPVARASVVMRSQDQASSTVIWECTTGKFDWTYDVDETIHIIEGSIVLSDDHNAPRRLGAGDIVFFPKGSQVRWEVDGYVKKVAFFRNALPNPLTPVFKVLRSVKRAMRRARAPHPAPALGAIQA